MRHETFSDFPEKQCNREDGQRADVTLLCEVRQSIRPWTRVRLMDMSRSGFRVAWFPGVDPQLPLKIKIPGLQILSANVRWKTENSLGCEFTEPLYFAVFEHIVRQSRSQLG